MKKIAIIALGLLTLVSGNSQARSKRHGRIKEKKLSRLQTGMTQYEIRKKLGKPRFEQDLGNGLTSYEYQVKEQRTPTERALVACGTLITGLLFLPLFLFVTEPEYYPFYLWFQDGILIGFGEQETPMSQHITQQAYPIS